MKGWGSSLKKIFEAAMLSLGVILGSVSWAGGAPKAATLCEYKLVPIQTRAYNKLKDEVPTLARLARSFLSRQANARLHAFFERTLLTDDVSVFWMSEEVKVFIGGGADALYFASEVRKWSVFSDSPEHQSINQGIEDERAQKGGFMGIETPYAVLVPDAAVETLAHELAHVLFNQWLNKNAKSLLERFPRSLVRQKANGRVMIHEQLLNLLDERFAHEVEFQVLSLAWGHEVKRWPARWHHPDTARGIDPDTLSGKLGLGVAEIYGITHPEALQYAGIPLRELLPELAP